MARIGTLLLDAYAPTTGVMVHITGPVTRAVPAGRLLVASLTLDATGSTDDTVTITDTKGNTWVRDTWARSGGTAAGGMFHCEVTTPLTTSDTLTITTTNNRIRFALQVEEWDLSLYSPLIDVTAQTSAATSAIQAGPTAVTAGSHVLVVGQIACGSLVPTPSVVSPVWNDVGRLAAGSTSIRTTGQYWREISAAPSTQQFNANFGSSTSSVISLVVFRLQATNLAPVANAGSDQSVAAGATVNLSGSASTDPDGTISNYSWAQIGTPLVVLNNSGTATPSFTAPSQVGGVSLTFRLTVTDNSGAQSTDDVVVNVAAPIGAGTLATVVGSTGIHTNSATPTCTLPNSGAALGDTMLAFVTTSDAADLSIVPSGWERVTLQQATGSIQQTIYKRPWAASLPSFSINYGGVAHKTAIAILNVRNLTSVTLGAYDSRATSGTTTTALGVTPPVTNQLVLSFFGDKSTPTGSQVVTAPGSTIEVQNVFETGGSNGTMTTLVVKETNSDALPHSRTATYATASGNSGAMQVLVNGGTVAVIPTASAGVDQTVEPWSTVSLSATDSDADGTVATRLWRVISGASAGLLAETSTRNISFTAPAGFNGSTIVLGYKVTDDQGNQSAEDTVTITVLPATDGIYNGSTWTPARLTRF